MADQLQLRGGTTTEHATFTGALREVTVDTTKKTLVVHDNATAGGTPLAKENLSNVPAGTITSTMIADGTIATADIADGAVTSAKIADGTIVNADINAAAAIDLTKLANGALPSGITVSSANITDLTLATADIADGAVTSAKIADGTIVNADVNAAAAIAGTKISPDFGSQNVTTTGTDTAASYSPTSSTAPTNGVYLPAANSVAISTGGSGRLFVDASGNVGINAAPPTASNAAGYRELAIRGGSTDRTGIIRLSDSAGTTGVSLYANEVTGLNLEQPLARPITFWTNGSEKVRITSAGLVGVGTSVPRSLLSLGAATATATATPDTLDLGGTYSTTAGANPKLRIFFDGTSSAGFGLSANQLDYISIAGNSHVFYAGTSQLMKLDSSGRLGIGTSNVNAPLEVNKAASGLTEIVRLGGTASATNDGWKLSFYQSTVGEKGYIGSFYDGSAWQTVTNGDIQTIRTGGTERVRVDSSGRVGIGSNAPSGQLDVAGSLGTFRVGTSGAEAFFTRNENNDLRANGGSSAALSIGGQSHVRFQTGSGFSEVGRWDSSGRFLVGTSSNNTSFGSAVQIAGTGSDATQSISRYVNSSGGPQLYFSKSRSGTVGSNTIVQVDDQLGFIGFYGANGTSYDGGASIAAFVDATPGASSDMPGRLVFSTTADGASSPTERLRIANNGAWGLAGANYGSSGQVLTSNGSGSAPTWSTPSGIGTGQTWQNVTGSRAFGTTYTNSTGKPIMVVIAFAYPGAGAAGVLTVDGVAIQFGQVNAAYINLASGTAIVPNGSTYAFNTTTTINNWLELR